MNKSVKSLFVASCALIVAAMPYDAWSETAKEQVTSIIRDMGYGGAIHNFKNYVIRGTQKHKNNADKQFAQILETINKLRGDSSVDQSGLDGIQNVATAYKVALSTVAKLIEQGKSASQIDQSVKISDGPAKAGIALLRKKWSWTPLEELEYTLGYGHAIHLFKNYVLRGKEKYREKAAQDYAKALQLIDAMRKAGKSPTDLADVEGVVKQYNAALASIQASLAQGKTPEQIDQLVKISDGPAKKGLVALR